MMIIKMTRNTFFISAEVQQLYVMKVDNGNTRLHAINEYSRYF